jgi:hypothetical protein
VEGQGVNMNSLKESRMSGQSSTPLRGRPIIKAFYDELIGGSRKRAAQARYS